jgi:CBS domain-containing protein
MTRHVISVAPDASVVEALRLMLGNKISGLPVVDQNGKLFGIITEGDFLRRAEIGTERRRPRWLEFLLGPGTIASDYIQSHARRVDEVMTSDVRTVTEEAPLGDIVALMEKYRIKRLPVVRGEELVGIVSRANLLRALASVVGEIAPGLKTDEGIRDRVLSELEAQSWTPGDMIDVIVRNGVVELWGTVLDARQRDAAGVAAETIPGVKAVKSHIVWIEPMSGMTFSDPEEDDGERVKGTAAPTIRPSDEKLAANG